MRVAIVSTQLPTACGLATFAGDLAAALRLRPEISSVHQVAVVPAAGVAPSDALTVIRRDDPRTYVQAARAIEAAGVDVVVLEHEFGIFGGADGRHVLGLTTELATPCVVTLHTVVPRPTPGQRAVLETLARSVAALQVFTVSARRMVVESLPVEPDRVHVVAHGAPQEICAVSACCPVPAPGAPFVVSTFGLLSSGKGYESAIEAIAKVAAARPEVELVIAGRTHPEVVRREGERYRQHLENQVVELAATAHIRFDDRFLSVTELADLLSRTSLFLTPYRSLDQIVSGALTFAVAAGRPVVTTPYRYALDLLGPTRCRIVPPDDAEALADAVLGLVDDRAELGRLGAASARQGSTLAWPSVAGTTADVLADAASSAGRGREGVRG